MGQAPPESPARIACLGWGSLIWKSDPLRLASGWAAGGPVLPIEFARVGDQGELATVIWSHPQAPRFPTRWAVLDTIDIAEARRLLAQREDMNVERAAFVTDGGPLSPEPWPFANEIRQWARLKQLNAVVWTALPPRYAGEEHRAPTVDEAVGYLQGLRGDVRDHAEHYVRGVPAEMRTPYRAAFEAQLGWSFRPAS